MPKELSGRDQDKWEPLIAIAEAIGGDLPQLMRAAAVAAAGNRSASETVGLVLLGDLKAMFDERATDRLSSQDIVAELAALEGRPWAEYGRGKPISKNQLAELLNVFTIQSATIRLPDGKTPKGYMRKQFDDVFNRYFPAQRSKPDGSPSPPLPLDTPRIADFERHNDTTAGGVGPDGDFQSATKGACGVSENGSNPNAEKDCGDVAVKKPTDGYVTEGGTGSGEAAGTSEKTPLADKMAESKGVFPDAGDPGAAGDALIPILSDSDDAEKAKKPPTLDSGGSNPHQLTDCEAVIAYFESRGIRLWAKGPDKIGLEPKSKVTAEDRAFISSCKPELLAYFSTLKVFE
jgi:hypothetical protein